MFTLLFEVTINHSYLNLATKVKCVAHNVPYEIYVYILYIHIQDDSKLMLQQLYHIHIQNRETCIVQKFFDLD